MAYHNIYQSYSWLGGHADGDPDLFAVALREAKEESGITELTPFSREILALDILPVPAHIKRGKPVKEHEHLNVTYLFIAPTDQTLSVKADENSAVAWIPIADLPKVVSEAVSYTHLGEFDQKGTVATKYGTRAEYLEAVAALHRAGIEVMADIVLNHRLGADAQDAYKRQESP